MGKDNSEWFILALNDYREKIANSHTEGKEILSKDWIDKYKHYYPVTPHNKNAQEIIDVEHVKRLMIFTEYVPVIPQFVEKWIEDKTTYTLGEIFEMVEQDSEISKWLYNNDDMSTNRGKELDLVIALRTGYYEVEKEKRFYVLGADDRTMLVRKMDHGIISTGDLIHVDELMGSERDSHALTEDEIKGYDERYWEFRREVDEDFNLID